MMIFDFQKPCLVFLFFLISSLALAQSSGEEAASGPDLLSYIQEKQGYDQGLINGVQYYNTYRRVLNHPFYSGEGSLPGAIILNGKRYDDVLVNYDIYSQYLVLEYKGIAEGINKIILSPAHTDAFQLDGNYFEKLTLDKRGPLFYQVITEGGLTCYVHWEKRLMATNYNLKYADYFTEPNQRYFLDFYGTLSSFKNKKTFVSLLSGVPKIEIKKYMRQNEIHFSDATSGQLKGLMKFISSRVEPKSGN